VVEIGTGCGTSGIWLLRGMQQAGVLTSVDIDPEHQRLARKAFMEAGFAANRYRLIGGKAADVLPRLTDGGYDMVFCDADKQEYPDYLAAALRLLRPGGAVAFDNALWGGRVADPERNDAETAAIREVCELVRNDPRLVPLLLPVGDGLLAAVKPS
jgi:predicted O-methyltransferase YrrM